MEPESRDILSTDSARLGVALESEEDQARACKHPVIQLTQLGSLLAPDIYVWGDPPLKRHDTCPCDPRLLAVHRDDLSIRPSSNVDRKSVV